MIKLVLFSVCVLFALSSTPALGSPGDEVLDEITIRVLGNDNLPDNVSDIALPSIGEQQEVELPDNANEAARQRANNAANAANNASDAAAEAADNAAEAARDAANNAREHAADAAEKGLNRAPGQNK
jgi:hypothetical protein